MLYRYFLSVFLVGLLLFCLPACQSPRERFQSETQDVLDQIPTPDEVELVCLEHVERLAKQGIGTSFGVVATYGTDLSYDDIAEQYRSQLTEHGWFKYGHTTWEQPLYCNPLYHGTIIEVSMLSSDIQCGNSSSVTVDDPDFHTFYILVVRKFPYDDIGECQK